MAEETEHKAKLNNTLSELVAKMALTIKEVKSCTIMAKQGDTQVQMVKESFEKMKSKNA